MLPRLLAALCLLTTLGVAAQEQAEDAKIWSGEGALGYTSSSGNTDSTNLNASLNVAREIMRWKHSLAVEAIQNETDGDKSARNAMGDDLISAFQVTFFHPLLKQKLIKYRAAGPLRACLLPLRYDYRVRTQPNS